MRKIILCRGIQGSGKTTWAKEWVLEDPEHRIRINNDDIRNMLGKYWVPSREYLVSGVVNYLLDRVMDAVYDYDIVIDNMNLNHDTVKEIQKKVNYKNAYKKRLKGKSRLFEVEFKDFFIPLEVCIERDSKRPNPIGEKVIRATYEKYKDIVGV